MVLAIIPAYNEEKRIAEVVRGVFPFVNSVVVVDDASQDSTALKAKEAGAVVLSHGINRGQGAALETGQAYARRIGANLVIHFDGDGQLDPADIPTAITALQSSNADMVLGTRYANRSGEENIPWLKRVIVHPLAAKFHKIFFGFSFSDAHNGFRVLNKKALNKIVITQDRMAHATEIPAIAVRSGLIIVEHPVTVRYYEFGQKPSAAFGIIKDLFFGWIQK